MATAKEMIAQAKGGKEYPYPSRFGSHKAMVDEDATKALLADSSYARDVVVCVDELGSYVTERKRLDDGCADPNRFSRFKV